MSTPKRHRVVELRPHLTVSYPFLSRDRAVPGRVNITATLSCIAAEQVTVKDALKLLKIFEGRHFHVRINERKGSCLFSLAVSGVRTTKEAGMAAQEFGSRLVRALPSLGNMTMQLDPQRPAIIQALWEQAA